MLINFESSMFILNQVKKSFIKKLFIQYYKTSHTLSIKSTFEPSKYRNLHLVRVCLYNIYAQNI